MMAMTSFTNQQIIGESYGFHDGALSVIRKDGTIEFAGHTERLTGIKHDKSRMPTEFIKHSEKTIYYERPFIKAARQWISGERIEDVIIHRPWHREYVPHHWAHAAGAYYTRPHCWPVEPVCLVVDSVGEFDTASMWYKKEKVWSMKYPVSLGLFYSAVTKEIGFTPNRDEHLTMAMSALGSVNTVLLDWYEEMFETGACHKGFTNPFFKDARLNRGVCAATAQHFLEKKLVEMAFEASVYSPYLCYAGGVALNCVANTKMRPYFEDMWIMPNPGDAGASLGAAAAFLDKPLIWKDPYLGFDPGVRMILNPKTIAKNILDMGAAGVISGRDEFGPRALGNRSILGDPRSRGAAVIRKIKNRDAFSPLAPAILSEHFSEYFEGEQNEYMSYVNRCMHNHQDTIHVNNTARVQSVMPGCRSILREILEEWYELTGCPFLINTSFNLEGKPMPGRIPDMDKLRNFEKEHRINVFA